MECFEEVGSQHNDIRIQLSGGKLSHDHPQNHVAGAEASGCLPPRGQTERYQIGQLPYHWLAHVPLLLSIDNTRT